MELRHVLGSTYVAVAATALLPIYKLNDTDIVLQIGRASCRERV